MWEHVHVGAGAHVKLYVGACACVSQCCRGEAGVRWEVRAGGSLEASGPARLVHTVADNRETSSQTI